MWRAATDMGYVPRSTVWQAAMSGLLLLQHMCKRSDGRRRCGAVRCGAVSKVAGHNVIGRCGVVWCDKC